MSYDDVHEQVQGILLSMVAEGRAMFSGIGPHGPTFAADPIVVWDQLDRAGLLSDDVPWPFTTTALARLRVEVRASLRMLREGVAENEVLE